MQNQTLNSSGQVHLSEPGLAGRRASDRFARIFSYLLAAMPILLTGVIALTFLFRSLPILRLHTLWDLISGSTWVPSEGAFGFFPFILGTLWVTIIGITLAVVPCILTALYLSEYARPRFTAVMKPLLDIMAAIPSVVYGVWGMIAIVPFVQKINPIANRFLGFIPIFRSSNPTGFSILAGGIVLAVMVTPFIIAVAYEVLSVVPDGLRKASLAVGATKWQTIKYGVFPQALPGLIASIVLGASRALGETMAVMMVVGNVAKVPVSIFDAAYPLPALIANNYGEMLSIPLYDSALMMAAVLLLVIIIFFNVLSALLLRRIVRLGWL